MLAIETKSLTKYYGKSMGIEDVTLNVNKGEVYGFIGPNGAGKSTFIRTLLNLIHKSDGSAKVFDLETSKNHVEVMRRLGYLPSDVDYYPELNARTLLKYSASFYGVNADQKIVELAERFQLDLDRSFRDLSLGNKKKVAIIQAVLHDPELIILDEPTSGLDPLMQNEFFNLLREQNAKGTTLFFSSHILSDIQKLCTKVAIIRKGKIVVEESIEEVLAKNLKNVEIILESADMPDPKMIDGILDYQRMGNKVNFQYDGDVNKLMELVSDLKLKDVVINEPNLEQIFMHYYE